MKEKPAKYSFSKLLFSRFHPTCITGILKNLPATTKTVIWFYRKLSLNECRCEINSVRNEEPNCGWRNTSAAECVGKSESSCAFSVAFVRQNERWYYPSTKLERWLLSGSEFCERKKEKKKCLSCLTKRRFILGAVIKLFSIRFYE